MGPVIIALVVLGIILLLKGAVFAPQQTRYVIERLGRYDRTLDAGPHILIPFFDKIRERHSLKEQVIDIPEQQCITSDNVQIGVDGIVYLRVVDAQLASYGIDDYVFAITQLAQTTLRSEFGKIELDRTFEARAHVNQSVVMEIDKAAEAWGVKVLRYEIKNINPPKEVIVAMEKQMRAEREKRAAILGSEGERDSAINNAEGEKQRQIKDSEAKMQSQINYARGEADAILQVAEATAKSIKLVGDALTSPGGEKAMNLRIAEGFLPQFGKIAQKANTIVIPANLGDMASMVAMAKGLFNKSESDGDTSVDKQKITRGS